MPDALSFSEIDGQHVEMFPARTVLSLFSLGGGGSNVVSTPSCQSAINQDFTNFASALNAAARQETHPAVAKVMTALADDYTALVESQSGAVPLPSVSTVQNDGAAFDKACP